VTTLREQNVERINSALPAPVRKLRANVILRDAFWYLRRNPLVWKSALGIAGVIFALFVIVNFLSGRIFPNVWSLGVALGGMTIEDAERALINYWTNDLQIDLYVEGQRIG